MPAKEGNVALTTSLSKDASALLTALAARPEYGTKGHVIEAGLHAVSQGQTESALVDSLHQQIAVLDAKLLTTVHEHQAALTTQHETLTTMIKTLLQTVLDLRSRLEGLEQRQDAFKAEVTDAYDRMRGALSKSSQNGFWSALKRG